MSLSDGNERVVCEACNRWTRQDNLYWCEWCNNQYCDECAPDHDACETNHWNAVERTTDYVRLGKWTIQRHWQGHGQVDTWHYVHDDYDGPPSRLCGYGRTLAQCVQQIDEMEEL